VDWGRLDRQLAALGEAVADEARSCVGDAERARRSLARLETLERLLATRSGDLVASPLADELQREAHGRPQRASLHESPLADLFRDTEHARRLQ